DRRRLLRHHARPHLGPGAAFFPPARPAGRRIRALEVDLPAMAGYAVACAALWTAGGPGVFDLDALVKERESTLASFRDPHASPLAAVARHDFAGDRPMTFGSAPDSDVPLEDVAARAAAGRA